MMMMKKCDKEGKKNDSTTMMKKRDVKGEMMTSI
jgi:hypothetical protein